MLGSDAEIIETESLRECELAIIHTKGSLARSTTPIFLSRSLDSSSSQRGSPLPNTLLERNFSSKRRAEPSSESSLRRPSLRQTFRDGDEGNSTNDTNQTNETRITRASLAQ